MTEKGAQQGQRIVGLAIDGQRLQRRGGNRRAVSADSQGDTALHSFQLELRQRLRRDEELLVAQEKVFGGQHGARAVATEHLVAAPGVGPELRNGGGDVAMQQQRGVSRQVVEQACRGLEEQRQVVLDAGRQDAVRDILVEADARGVALEDLAEALAEQGTAGLAGGELARRQEADLRHRVEGTLGIDVEAADGFDLVVEELDAVGQLRAHREKVYQAATHAVFAGGNYLGHVLVAGQAELRAQGI